MLILYQLTDMTKPKFFDPAGSKNDPQENDPQRRVTKLMKRILTHFRAAMDEQLRPYGVTTAQIRLLGAIASAPGSSGAELARRCEITPQTAQVLIERAEESGWIIRSKDAVNERILIASLTLDGEKLLKMADRVLRKLERRLWTDIPLESIDSLSGTLEQCLRNIS
jgi:DNA-binding MarR family transcriptional regulator